MHPKKDYVINIQPPNDMSYLTLTTIPADIHTLLSSCQEFQLSQPGEKYVLTQEALATCSYSGRFPNSINQQGVVFF